MRKIYTFIVMMLICLGLSGCTWMSHTSGLKTYIVSVSDHELEILEDTFDKSIDTSKLTLEEFDALNAFREGNQYLFDKYYLINDYKANSLEIVQSGESYKIEFTCNGNNYECTIAVNKGNYTCEDNYKGE